MTVVVTLQVARNGGSPATGGITAAGGDVIHMSLASLSGIGAVKWRIYGFPPGYTVPSGWLTDSDGTYYAITNGSPPTDITLPSTAVRWGKWLLQAIANDDATLEDSATAVQTLSPSGLKDTTPLEAQQFTGGYARGQQDNWRIVETLTTGGTPTTVAMGGDVSGSSNAATVAKIRGLAIDTVAPTDGQVATWEAASSKVKWKTPASGSFSGNATSIQGNPVVPAAASIGDGQTYVYDDADSQLEGSWIRATSEAAIQKSLTGLSGTVTILQATDEWRGVGGSGGRVFIFTGAPTGNVHIVTPQPDVAGGMFILYGVDSTTGGHTIDVNGVNLVHGSEVKVRGLGNGATVDWLAISASAGVASLNALTGALSIVAGSNVTVTPSGSNITIASTGGGGGGTEYNYDLTGLSGTISSSAALTLAKAASVVVFSGAPSGAVNIVFGTPATVFAQRRIDSTTGGHAISNDSNAIVVSTWYLATYNPVTVAWELVGETVLSGTGVVVAASGVPSVSATLNLALAANAYQLGGVAALGGTGTALVVGAAGTWTTVTLQNSASGGAEWGLYAGPSSPAPFFGTNAATATLGGGLQVGVQRPTGLNAAGCNLDLLVAPSNGSGAPPLFRIWAPAPAGGSGSSSNNYAVNPAIQVVAAGGTKGAVQINFPNGTGVSSGVDHDVNGLSRTTNLRVTALGSGVAHLDASGNVTSSAVVLGTDTSGSLTIAGDVTGNTGASVVSKVNGATIPTIGTAYQGLRVNSGASALEYADPTIDTYVTLSIAGGAGTSTLSSAQEICGSIEVSGAITGNRIVQTTSTLANMNGARKRIRNITTGGGFYVTFQCPTGTSIFIPRNTNGAWIEIECDGVGWNYVGAGGGFLLQASVTTSVAGGADTQLDAFPAGWNIVRAAILVTTAEVGHTTLTDEVSTATGGAGDLVVAATPGALNAQRISDGSKFTGAPYEAINATQIWYKCAGTGTSSTPGVSMVSYGIVAVK
jgi:hypothetical protein